MQHSREGYESNDAPAGSRQDEGTVGTSGSDRNVPHEHQFLSGAVKERFEPSRSTEDSPGRNSTVTASQGPSAQDGVATRFGYSSQGRAPSSSSSGEYKPRFSSAAPSAGWSTASPAASWVSAQNTGTDHSRNAAQTGDSFRSGLEQRTEDNRSGQSNAATGDQRSAHDLVRRSQEQPSARSYNATSSHGSPVQERDKMPATSVAQQQTVDQHGSVDTATGDLPENINIGFSGKGQGIYGSFATPERNSRSAASQQGASQGSTGYDSTAEGIRPVATSQATGHRPTFSSESPSARWSSHSPSASWGTSQTAGSNQQAVLTNTDRSVNSNPVQQSQPSQTDCSSEVAYGRERSGAADQADGSLLEKAKQYLPGSSQPRQDNANQGGVASEGNLSGYRGSEGYESMAEGLRPVATSQTGRSSATPATSHRPTASSDSSSAQWRSSSPTTWSSSSPSAGWGTNQAAGTAQAGESSGPSLLQKVKEYLPGQSSTTAERSSYEVARPAHDSAQGGFTGYSGNAEGQRPVASSQAAGSHRSTFTSESPSARWSSSSPSASWGTSQTAGQQPSATQAEDKGSGKGVVETLKEYLPGSHQPQNGADLGDRQAVTGTDASRQSATSQTAGYQPNSSSQISIRQGPSFSSESPSARWSSTSPSAGWGASESVGNQSWSSQAEGATGPSLLQKVKEYLPGTGQGQTQPNGVSREGQQSNRDELPVVPVGANQAGTYSRPGAEPVVLGSASNLHTSADNNYSPDRVDKLSNEGGLSNNRTVGTVSNPDSLSGSSSRPSEAQHDSMRPGYTHGENFGQREERRSQSRSPTRRTEHNSASNRQTGRVCGQQLDGYSNGLSRGLNAEEVGRYGSSQSGVSDSHQYGGQQTSYNDQEVSYEPVPRLPSTGIPPIFHPPPYITSDIPSYRKTELTGDRSSQVEDVNARQALQPLTQIAAGDSRFDSQDSVHAKDALQPLTQVAAGGNSYQDRDTVHARDALQPLTQVPADTSGYADRDTVHAKDALQPLTAVPADGTYGQTDTVHARDALQPLTTVPVDRTGYGQTDTSPAPEHERKGIIESVMEYLPGHQQTGAVQQEQYQSAQPTQQAAHNSYAALNEPDYHQTSPSLLDKAKAYIPVLGSSTEFDPAAEARAGQQERLFQDVPQDHPGYEPEDSHHEGFLDKARAYMPTMGAPGTTTAGIDPETGASSGPPHKGLVEELVEKAKEYLPHQLTGAEPHPTHASNTYNAPAGSAYAGSTGSAYPAFTPTYNREVDPNIGGVRVSSRPILGPNAAPEYSQELAAGHEEPHGIIDKVKQLVGLAPAETSSVNDPEDAAPGPVLANQGVNAGLLGIGSSGREDSTASALDVFYDASEEPVGDSFTSANTGYATTDYRTPDQSTAYGTGQTTTGYSSNDSTARNDAGKQPYVNQAGPPVVDTSNDPDDTFGPVNPRNQPTPSRVDNREARAPASFGDDDNQYEGTGGTPGKKGLRARMKGRLGAKKEQHEEKKRTKADHELQEKMQQKEIPKSGAVTTPAAAPDQGAKAPTAGSNVGPGGGGGMMGGVAGGTPADPQGNSQSASKEDAGKPPAAAKTDNFRTPHEAIKANQQAGGSNITMGNAAQEKSQEVPPKKSKGGFMSKLKKPFNRK